MSVDPARGPEEDLAAALPGLTRIAGYAALHTAEWGLRTSARAGFRVARAVSDPDEAASLARDAHGAATALGGLARSVASGMPLGRALVAAGEALGAAAHAHPGSGPRDTRHADPPAGPHEPCESTAAELRRRGAELLERSRDVWSSEDGHPAYDRMLDELAPDEARILLLLLREGPQPSVDVRTGGPVGMVNSQLVAPGLTMIGSRAGCRWGDHVPSYLNNLFRLGLVWFSRESLRDPMDYQVLEAQPDVLEAMHSVRFAKVVRRSIHLTPFGEDFCRTCLVDETSAGGTFPAHQPPPESNASEPPSQA